MAASNALNAPNQNAPSGARASLVLAVATLALAFALLTVPAILHGGGVTSEQWDQDIAHWPTVQQFARQFPTPRIDDYPSATGPGYHLLLAPLVAAGASLTTVRLASALFGLAFILVAWKGAARWVGAWPAVALVAPLLCSSYLVAGSVWLTTDSLALTLAATLLALAAFGVPRAGLFVQCALLGMAALAVRQTMLWTAAPLLVAGILGSPLGNHAGPGEQWTGDAPRRWWRLGLAALAVLAMLLTLGAFVSTWGGLTPPQYQERLSRTFAVAAPALGLGLVGLWGGMLLLPDLPRVFAQLWRSRGVAAGVAALALVAALVPETSFDRDAGRWGGPIWQLVARTPAPGERSLVLAGLACAGALVLLTLWQRAAERGRGRAASVIVVALLAMMAVQIGNKELYERYQDPVILLSLAWLAAMGCGRGEARTGRLALGALLLAAAQLAVTLANTLLPVFRGDLPA